MDDLTLIRQVLASFYEEIHHPGYCRDSHLDVDQAFDKAKEAWKRINRIVIDARQQNATGKKLAK